MKAALIAIVLVLAASPAHADGPLVAAVGGGPTIMRWDPDDGTRWSLSLHVDLAVRVHPAVAVGVHAGATIPTAASDFVFEGSGPGPGSHFESIHYGPLELGLGGTFALGQRAWIAPWLGQVDIQTSGSSYTGVPRLTAFGFDVGVDLRSDDGQRLGLFAAITSTVGADYDSFRELTVGAAYRYW